MYQYMPSYPKAFGNPAWSLHGSMDDAFQQDLFWRKVQTDPDLVFRLAALLDPGARLVGEDIFLSDEISISLHPESCGAYATRRNGQNIYLSGNSMDQDLISKAEQHPSSCGYYLGPLFQRNMGWLPQNVCSNILQRLEISLNLEDRYLFSRKACHSYVLMKEKDKNDALCVIENFQINLDLKRYGPYWYSAEDGSIVFGTVYFCKEPKKIFKFPISAWIKNFNAYGNSIFDLIHPNFKVPLYDMHELVRWSCGESYALICKNEIMCEYIKKKHAWITIIMPVTTYSSIEMSDWSSLRSMIPIIFPEKSASGCYEAYKVFLTLKKHGFSPVFLKRQNVEDSPVLDQDLSCLAYPKCTSNLTEFAEHCRQAFNVEPPQGILPKGQPLLELPGGDSEPELLLERLLSLGDQMTLFAWRGVGKSLFALLLAICFANGQKALSGRVCPSRKYRVLVIDAELPKSSLIKRAKLIAKGLGLPESAANEILFRSSVVEKEDIRLDTEVGWEDLLPDLERADIVIVDSLFKVFPSSMSSGISNADAPNKFYDWCRKHGKTAIVVDHQGKKGDTAYGTMGKEIALDVVLQLKKGKNAIEAIATKNRNFESNDQCWVRYSIKSESDNLTFQPNDQTATAPSTIALPSGEDEGMKNSDKMISAPDKPDIDQAILDYVKEHPGQKQGEVCDAIVAMGLCKRATAHSHYKMLREENKLAAPDEADTTRQQDDATC